MRLRFSIDPLYHRLGRYLIRRVKRWPIVPRARLALRGYHPHLVPYAAERSFLLQVRAPSLWLPLLQQTLPALDLCLKCAMTGRNFQNSEGLSCRFGLSLYTVGARYLTSRTIECTAPAQRAGSVPLSLSLNGQQFVNIGTAYTYHDPPQVAAIVPLRGPPDGGTLAELHFASNSARATPFCSSKNADLTRFCRGPRSRSISKSIFLASHTVPIRFHNRASEFCHCLKYSMCHPIQSSRIYYSGVQL